jgi:hypothetical protein
VRRIRKVPVNEKGPVQVEETAGGERSLATQDTVSLNLPLDLNLLLVIFTATVVSVLGICLLIVFVMVRLSQRHSKERLPPLL